MPHPRLPDVHVGAAFATMLLVPVPGVLSTIPVTVSVMVPVTMKMLVSVAIIVAMPVPTVRVVIGCVVTRCIREWLDDRHAGQSDTDADIGMRLGGRAVRNAGDPQSST
jgi:hypothetical protein